MHSERSPFTVLDTAAFLRDEADGAIGARIRSLPGHGQEITCREGCDACCHQLVMISPLEAHAIADYVHSRPELARAVETRTGEWQARVTSVPGLCARLAQLEPLNGYPTEEQGGALEEEYFDARLPCPFLMDARCSIYPVRPFSCREHYVTSDPALCGVSLGAPVQAGTRMEFRAVANWVSERVFSIEDRLIPLPHALNYAGEHRSEAESRADSGSVRAAVETARRRVRLALARLGIH